MSTARLERVRGAAAVSPELCSAAASSPEQAETAPQVSVWHAVWPGRVYAGRVIYWWALRGVMGTGRGCATVMAGLGGGERRSTVFGPLEGAMDYTNTPKRERGRRVFSPSLGTAGRVAERGLPARSSGDGRSEVVARSKTCCFLRPGPTG